MSVHPLHSSDINEVCPAALIIDGVKTTCPNWHTVLTTLAEAAIDAGKEIPATFFRDGPSSPRVMETQLKGGQWLYMNLSKSDRVQRIHAFVAILAVPVFLECKSPTGTRTPVASTVSWPARAPKAPAQSPVSTGTFYIDAATVREIVKRGHDPAEFVRDAVALLLLNTKYQVQG
jgi:hypothetical protein